MNQKNYVSSITSFGTLPDEATIRVKAASSLLSCSVATIWRMAKAGRIKTVKISDGVTGVRVGSIRALLNGSI